MDHQGALDKYKLEYDKVHLLLGGENEVHLLLRGEERHNDMCQCGH